jgi:hypothetical protein
VFYELPIKYALGRIDLSTNQRNAAKAPLAEKADDRPPADQPAMPSLVAGCSRRRSNIGWDSGRWKPER